MKISASSSGTLNQKYTYYWHFQALSTKLLKKSTNGDISEIVLFSILSFHLRIINPEGLLSKYLSLHVLKQSFGSWKIIIGFIKIYSSLIICSFEFFFFWNFSFCSTLKPKIFVWSDTPNPEQSACKVSTLNLSHGTCYRLWNFSSIAFMEYIHPEKRLTSKRI